jgi:hypothetical protein
MLFGIFIFFFFFVFVVITLLLLVIIVIGAFTAGGGSSDQQWATAGERWRWCGRRRWPWWNCNGCNQLPDATLFNSLFLSEKQGSFSDKSYPIKCRKSFIIRFLTVSMAKGGVGCLLRNGFLTSVPALP